MKTVQMWNEAPVNNFDDFFHVGDEVSEDVWEYFLSILPPRVWDEKKILQVGEPSSEVRGLNTYSTFIREEGKIIFKGDCFPGMSTVPVDFTDSEWELYDMACPAMSVLRSLNEESYTDMAIRRMNVRKMIFGDSVPEGDLSLSETVLMKIVREMIGTLVLLDGSNAAETLQIRFDAWKMKKGV